jgi:uncharacterized protein
MSKITVIHHSADFDGLFCREIARKFLPDAELVGWDFGDAPVPIPDGQIYVMDLPVDRVFGLEAFDRPSGGSAHAAEVRAGLLPRVIWIDHHKTSIASHPKDIEGYRIDGVAACRLAWQSFLNKRNPFNQPPQDFLEPPVKQDFIDRKVSEPYAVRLAGEYDIWDKRDPNAELFQHGLRSCDLTPLWEKMFNECELTGAPTVHSLLEKGRGIQYAKTRENEDIIRDYGYTIKWEGLTFLAVNNARFNSLLFTAGLKPEHDACLGYVWDPSKRRWKVSLYHAPWKEHHDLSVIAVKYGGGGHRGACGMLLKHLPKLS